MSTRETLLEFDAPNGNRMAIVEHDGASCYFYLYTTVNIVAPDSTQLSVPTSIIKACWVRNLRPAPEELDVAAMQNGDPPMLPRPYCRHPQGAPLPSSNQLKVVWSESGDAAALYEGDELLAVIPSWSGMNGFTGYARDCIGESPLCWELGTPETNAQFKAFRAAAEYWRAWDKKPGPWPGYLSAMTVAYKSLLGAHPRTYAIDGGNWPPKIILRGDRKDNVRLVTLGVGIRSQPHVDRYCEQPSGHRRIELGVCLAAPISEAAIMRVGEYLSGQSNLPWTQDTFLDDGHTIPSDVFSELSGTRISSLLLSRKRFSSVLLHAAPSGAPTVALPPFRGDSVRLLWMIPITEKERQLAISRGSDELKAALGQHNLGWPHRFDRQVVA